MTQSLETNDSFLRVVPFALCNISMFKQIQSDSSQSMPDIDEDKRLRMQLRQFVIALPYSHTAESPVSDNRLHALLGFCAMKGWTEELRLVLGLPKSQVKCHNWYFIIYNHSMLYLVLQKTIPSHLTLMQRLINLEILYCFWL